MRKQINWKEEASKWQAQYNDWRVSGLSQKEYSENKGLRLNEFKSRIQMMRAKGLMAPGDKRVLSKLVQARIRPGFSEVKITGVPKATAPEAYCEIRFGDSGRIVIENESSLEKLRELVGALRL